MLIYPTISQISAGKNKETNAMNEKDDTCLRSVKDLLLAAAITTKIENCCPDKEIRKMGSRKAPKMIRFVFHDSPSFS